MLHGTNLILIDHTCYSILIVEKYYNMTIIIDNVQLVVQGLKIIAGQDVSTQRIKCDNSGAQCYNMTVNVFF